MEKTVGTDSARKRLEIDGSERRGVERRFDSLDRQTGASCYDVVLVTVRTVRPATVQPIKEVLGTLSGKADLHEESFS